MEKRDDCTGGHSNEEMPVEHRNQFNWCPNCRGWFYPVMKKDPGKGPFFIYGEDFSCGLVGPFEYYSDAAKHLVFQEYRGDASVCVHDNARIVTEADPLYQKAKGFIFDPEKDKHT